MEFFCHPGEDLKWFGYWKDYCNKFLISLGIKEENLRNRDHDPAALAFYSKATTDIEYLFPLGWGELWGIADRTDYDLGRHMEHSGEALTYTDPFTNEKFVPYCVEPAVGVDRIVLAVLCEAYDKEQLEKDTRTVMHLSPALAPYKVAVLPLSKQLKEEAEELLYRFVKEFPATYDETGSIGKRYRRQDSIGTPFCVTVDFDSNEQKTYTLRNRDTMEQVRLTYDEIVDYINNAIRI
jgi:glycyl-tRNA synthetase